MICFYFLFTGNSCCILRWPERFAIFTNDLDNIYLNHTWNVVQLNARFFFFSLSLSKMSEFVQFKLIFEFNFYFNIYLFKKIFFHKMLLFYCNEWIKVKNWWKSHNFFKELLLSIALIFLLVTHNICHSNIGEWLFSFLLSYHNLFMQTHWYKINAELYMVWLTFRICVLGRHSGWFNCKK